MTGNSSGHAAEATSVKLLSQSPTDWVARLARGANCVFFGVVLNMMTNGLAKRISSVGPIIELLPDVVFFIGIWMLTAPEPGEPNSALGFRGLTRGLSVLSVTYDIVFAGVSFVTSLNTIPMRGVGQILGGILSVLIAFHVANLATRIPDSRLATHARFVMTGSGIIALIIAAILLGGVFLPVGISHLIRESIRGSTGYLLSVFIVVILVAFVLDMWRLWIFYRFQKLLTQQATRTESAK